MIAWLLLLALALPVHAGVLSSHPGGQARLRANQYGEGGVTGNLPNLNNQITITTRDEYYLDYWMRFLAQWDADKGGKLPGLRGAPGEAYGCDPGIEPDGWSLRHMWNEDRDNQGFRIYAYYQLKNTRCGEEFLYNPRFTIAQQESTDGTWFRITQRVRINTPNQNDGIVQGWFNGQQRFSRTNVRLRGNVSSSVARINRLWLNVFRGGNDSSWAAPQDNFIEFKTFYLLDCLPNFSGNENSVPSCDPPGPPPPPPPPPDEDPPEPSAGFVLRSGTNVVYVDLADPNGGINANPATGFTVRVNGGIATITQAFCVSTTSFETPTNLARCPIVHTSPITSGSDVVTVSYSQASGNVVDAQGEELVGFSNLPVQNLYDRPLNIKTVVSATPTVDAGRPVSGLFDGDFVTETSSAVVSNSTTFQIVLDFFAQFQINGIVVGGDNTASKQCLTYDVEWRPAKTGAYTLILDDIDCNAQSLVTTAFPAAVNARELRVTFTGPAAGTQVFELDATPGGDPPPPPPPVTPVPPTLTNRITLKGVSHRGLHLK